MSSMICELIKSKRKELGLKQTDLAEKAGVSQANISKIESGNAKGNTEHLKKLAEVLDIDISSLIDSPEQMKENIRLAVNNMNDFDTTKVHDFVRFVEWDGKTV